MTTLEAIEQRVGQLSPAERAELFQWLVRDIGGVSGVAVTPDVCGGEPCIVRTRIPVWVLVQARRLGTTDAELLRAYPTLTAEDLVNAWAYYRSHPAEIDQQIRDNEEA